MAFRSSGNLTADRRFGYAMAAKEDGDWAEAAELMQQTLELAPDWASGWFMLGEILREGEKSAEAAQAYRRAYALDPGDSHGASLRLARIAGETIAMPTAYVAGLFDDYAAKFDRALRHELHYNAPELLSERVRQLRPHAHFAHALDLGCGTGLAAQAFQSRVERFSGIDLSSGMIRRAAAKGLYATLAVGDLLPWLVAMPPATADLAIAADVFVYLRDLAPVFTALAPDLATGGLFAFTIQSHQGSGTLLGEDMRYAHDPREIEHQLTQSGFALRHEEAAAMRLDRGRPVPGHLMIAERV